MILVTNGNGRLSRLLITILRGEYSVSPRVMVRNVSAARTDLGGDVDIVGGELADAAAVDRAMAGVEAVFLCSPVNPSQVSWQSNLVRAAKNQGAAIVKISGLGTTPDSSVDSGRWHAQTEAEIRASGVPFAFLRPNFFFQNLAFQLPLVARHGVIRSAVDDARIAMVDAGDISAMAARLLVERPAGQELVPTASLAFGYTDIADILSQVTNTVVSYQRQSDTELREVLTASGQPDWHVRLLLQFNAAFRAGIGAEVTDHVKQVLGRPPRTLEAFLHAAQATADTGTNPFPS